MTRLLTAGILSSVVLMPAFAKAAEAASPRPVPASGIAPQPAPGVNAGQPASDASAPASPAASALFLPVVNNIPLPEKRANVGNKRGSKSIYPFDTLEIGGSFGVTGKTWKNMASTVASANSRYLESDKLVELKNADGSAKMIDVDIPGGGKATVPAKGPERQFWGCAVDPKTDPQGATVRVWRVALDDARIANRKPRKAK